MDKIEKLARDVLRLSRNTLLVNLRFMDMALSCLDYVPIDNGTIVTDGAHIYFHPHFVLQSYKEAKEIPVRQYLHMVMHCVFRHMFMDPTLDPLYWDLACDIAVENVINDLGLRCTQTAKEQQQAEYIQAVKEDLKYVTAEKIYSYLRQAVPDRNHLEKIHKLFCADDHTLWYTIVMQVTTQKMQSDSSQNAEASDAAQSNTATSEQIISRTELTEQWQKISERMQTELEDFCEQAQGTQRGALRQNLMEVNREKYDYTEFLKKFAVLCEAMKVNDDEFDYIFYTYGLQLYGKMPLIEPLEYKDVKQIREFIIAIDTSGSTSGELVQKFVQKTYNILKSTESFYSKINLHIIQSDADIQEDVKITNQAEFDQYLQTMEIKGLGGTDFRPVFSYVDELILRKEFSNLKGLIYFTDGYGTFPEKMPSYQTAFVFVEDGYDQPDVPTWAIKLVLSKDEI